MNSWIVKSDFNVFQPIRFSFALDDSADIWTAKAVGQRTGRIAPLQQLVALKAMAVNSAGKS